ncbi:hypothetical protein SDC9_147870 [bioreactor metagenome]|uniref:Uncharacterized protein n=1 Tax=bioreactor metagenome TaxID=1076179 RepID=A0A645EIX5_9ZZZZ
MARLGGFDFPPHAFDQQLDFVELAFAEAEVFAESELSPQFRFQLEKGAVSGFVGQVEIGDAEQFRVVEDVVEGEIVIHPVSVRIARFDQEEVSGGDGILFGGGDVPSFSGDDQNQFMKGVVVHVDRALVVEVQHLDRKILVRLKVTRGAHGGAEIRASGREIPIRTPCCYLTMSRSSTSNFSAALGGMACPAPCSP